MQKQLSMFFGPVQSGLIFFVPNVFSGIGKRKSHGLHKNVQPPILFLFFKKYTKPITNF